jgi:hypothetical protein
VARAGRVLDTYWDRFLAAEPLFATLVGDSRFDDVLPDPAEALADHLARTVPVHPPWDDALTRGPGQLGWLAR